MKARCSSPPEALGFASRHGVDGQVVLLTVRSLAFLACRKRKSKLVDRPSFTPSVRFSFMSCCWMPTQLCVH